MQGVLESDMALECSAEIVPCMGYVSLLNRKDVSPMQSVTAVGIRHSHLQSARKIAG